MKELFTLNFHKTVVQKSSWPQLIPNKIVTDERRDPHVDMEILRSVGSTVFSSAAVLVKTLMQEVPALSREGHLGTLGYVVVPGLGYVVVTGLRKHDGVVTTEVLRSECLSPSEFM